MPIRTMRTLCRPEALKVPTARLVNFDFSGFDATNWHALGPHVTHFYSALSLMLPAGERFLIDVVRDYLPDVHDTHLRNQMLGFIGQEAVHSRIHRVCNERLGDSGLPVQKIECLVGAVLGLRRRYTPRLTQLAVAVALESFTASLGAFIISRSARIEESDNPFAKMWLWHSLEEVEHKGVLVDVWNAVVKPGARSYLLRASTMIFATLAFWISLFFIHTLLIAKDPKLNGHCQGMWRVSKYLFGSRGVFKSIARECMQFFRPGFHPWNHDNSALLSHLETLEAGRVVTRLALRTNRANHS